MEIRTGQDEGYGAAGARGVPLDSKELHLEGDRKWQGLGTLGSASDAKFLVSFLAD